MPVYKIRPVNQTQDVSQVLKILKAIIEEGTAFEFDHTTTESDLIDYWFNPKAYTYVCVNDTEEIVGFYSIKPNHTGRGAHVANAGYAVSIAHKGKGIGKKMGEDSLIQAKSLGFKAMQFNIVVSTNEPAVKLWQQLGFKIVGTVPQAFNHIQRELVDIYIMHRFL